MSNNIFGSQPASCSKSINPFLLYVILIQNSKYYSNYKTKSKAAGILFEKYQIFWFYVFDQKLLLVTFYVKSYLTSHPSHSEPVTQCSGSGSGESSQIILAVSSLTQPPVFS